MRGGIAGRRCEERRCGVQKLGGEESEGFGVVNVVPERELDEVEAGGAAAVPGFGGDGGGAPGDVGEGFGVGVAEAYEVVAAVVRRAEDYARFARGEGFDGLLVGGGGDSGRVGIDEADGAVTAGKEVVRGVEEALAEGVAALRDEREAGGEEVVEELLIADGGVGDYGGGARAGESGEGVCGVLGVKQMLRPAA